jgi:hypothetical protein
LLLIVLACVAGIAWTGANAGSAAGFFHYFVCLALLGVAGWATSAYLTVRLADEATRQNQWLAQLGERSMELQTQMANKQMVLLTQLTERQMELGLEHSKIALAESSRHTQKLEGMVSTASRVGQSITTTPDAAQHGAAADDRPQAGDRG